MKLIVLDCDGIINQDRDDPVKSADEWISIEGSVGAIAFLIQIGYTVAVATNQSGIGRRYFTVQDLTEMYAKMYRLAVQAGGATDSIWFCPHTAADNCDYYRPKPGMTYDILEHFRADPAEIWLVGNGLRDLQAVDAADGKSALVLTGKGKKTLSEYESELSENTQIFDNLPASPQYITQGTAQDRADGQVNA